MSNVVIRRREYRETLTFTQKPSAETCRALRNADFDYDRSNGIWWKKAIEPTNTDEQSVVSSLNS